MVQSGEAVKAYATIAGRTYVTAGTERGYIEAKKLVVTASVKQVLSGLTPNCSKFKTFEYIYDDGHEKSIITDKCFMLDGVLHLGSDEIAYGYYRSGNRLSVDNVVSPPLVVKFPLYVGKAWSSYGGGLSTYEYRVISLNETFEIKGKVIKNVVKIDVGSYLYFSHE